jgi:hypothetical protein
LFSNTKDTGSSQPGNQQQIPWKKSQAKVYLREELAKGDPSSHPYFESALQLKFGQVKSALGSTQKTTFATI